MTDDVKYLAAIRGRRSHYLAARLTKDIKVRIARLSKSETWGTR